MSSNAYAMPAAKRKPVRRGRGRPSVAAVQTTNAAILAAALEVFASKGFDGATFAEIARQAGVTRRTLYARYPTKALLLSDTVTGLIDERMQFSQLTVGETARAVLLNIVTDLTVRSPSAPLLMRIIIAEGENFLHDGVSLGLAGREHLLDQLRLVFEDLMQRGLLASADAAKAASLFTDMVIASSIMSLLTYAPNGTAESVLEPRVDFFCRGFASWAQDHPAPDKSDSSLEDGAPSPS